MSFLNLWKSTHNKKYRIPVGTTAKNYAQSLLNTVKYHCDEINASTTVIGFLSSYQMISEILDELIWLNEKKHVSMSPPPRNNWIRIQTNLSATINDFLGRALSSIPLVGVARADAIDELLRDIEQNESFLHLFSQENKLRLEELRTESEGIREASERLYSRQQCMESNAQNLFTAYGGIDAALLSIDLMEGHAFEHWCADALKNIGFYDVEVTPSSGDHGVDVLAKKDGVKYAIQCKRYNSDLGNKPIQEVHAGKALYHCHVGVVITNQYFTAGANTLAKATDTLLWDRDWIKHYLMHHSNISNQLTSTRNTTLGYAEDEELLCAAVDVILETGQASIAMVQCRLKLGYAAAARLIDKMEKRGIVGPFQGSKPRKILITKEQWRVRKGK